MNGVKGVAIVLLLVGFLFSLAYFDVGLTGRVVDTNYIDSTDTVSNNLISVLISLNNLPMLDEFIFNWDGTDYSTYDDSLILMMNFEDDVNDVSSYGHNGTILSGVSYVDSKYSKGLNFSEGGGVNISASDDFNVDEFTISLWVKNNDALEIVDVFVGKDHGCVLNESGSIICWGDNTYGQLGNGNEGIHYNYPVVVSGNNVFVKFGKSSYPASNNVCGLLQNGTALCWGDNSQGQLGDNTTVNKDIPTPIYGDYNFSMVDAGQTHSCGLLQNGTALCWGDNGLGQLGDNKTTDRLIPTSVYGNYNFSYVSAGDSHTCGLLYNGSILCWGRNDHGQVGDNTTTQKNLPVFVKGGNVFEKLINSNDFACGLLANGSAMCWGTNLFGSLGNGGTESEKTPSPVYGGYSFDSLSCFYAGCCGLLTNGSTMCWGSNKFGQLGIGTKSISESKVPLAIDLNIEFNSLYSGSTHSCGLSEDDLFCWGDNGEGQLNSGLFTLIDFTTYLDESKNFNILNLGAKFTCGLSNDGSLYCIGFNNNGQLGDNSTDNLDSFNEVYGDYNFSSFEIGYLYTCGLLQNGTALCWGDNSQGQIGDNTNDDRWIPTSVHGNYGFSHISLGQYSTCGLLQNGTALCWGDGLEGQLGNNATGDSLVPTSMYGNYTFSEIVAGSSKSFCGFLINGTALCWGDNSKGQIGDNTTTDRWIPTSVYGNYDFSSLHIGRTHVCGLLQNGTALCWGDNTFGQLGDNQSCGLDCHLPQPIFGNYVFTDFDSYSNHNCGVLENGSMLCWGRNNNGQLGDGTTDDYYVPIFVYNEYSFSSVSLGFFHTCGGLTNGRFFCWGSNTYNEIGAKSFDATFPIPAVRDVLFGKSQYLYRIYHTFGGNLKFIVENNEIYAPLDDGWNNLVFSYEEGVQKAYLNGGLYFSLDSGAVVNDRDWDVLLGRNYDGQVDEVRMWNRSLSDSEIEMLYRSNLMKVDNDSWTFEFSTSMVKDVYTYFAKAIVGSSIWELVTRTISAVVDSGGSTGAPSSISAGTLSAGFERFYSVGESLSFEAPEGDYSFVVSSVEEGEVILILNGESYSFSDWERIDLDGDGDYDVEVSVDSINEAGQVELSIVIVDEPVEFEEPVVEEAWKEGLTEEEIEVVERKSNFVYWVLVGVVVLILGFVGFRFFGKGKKGKK